MRCVFIGRSFLAVWTRLFHLTLPLPLLHPPPILLNLLHSFALFRKGFFEVGLFKFIIVNFLAFFYINLLLDRMYLVCFDVVYYIILASFRSLATRTHRYNISGADLVNEVAIKTAATNVLICDIGDLCFWEVVSIILGVSSLFFN